MEQQSSASKSVRFATFAVDLKSGELRKYGRKIRLPYQSFQVLARLLERPGELVSREELRHILWPDDTYVDFEMGLSSAVRKLRDALGDSAEHPRFVETLPRFGYRFIAPVNNGSAENSGITTPVPVAATSAPAATESLTSPVHASSQRGRRRSVALTVLALIVVAAVFTFRTRNRIFPNSSIHSLAVLPLENLTGDPGQEYFADGLTDALTTMLAETTNLEVTSRTSTMGYKPSQRPLPALPVIGRELNVDAIVAGTLVRSGRRVRVDAQLIDARTDRHLWANTFERAPDDIVALQADLAQAIATEIQGTLSAQQRAGFSNLRSVNEEATELFFRATEAFGRDGFRDAIRYLDAAIVKQPDFARAYAFRALAYTQFSFVAGPPPIEFMRKAEADALKAIELDEAIPDAHAALGIVLFRFQWNLIKAEQEFRRSVQLNQSSAEGHRRLAGFLSNSGRANEAVQEARRARDLDPLSDSALLILGIALRDAGENDGAIGIFQELVRKRPDLARAHFFLGVSYVTKGSLDDGIKELQQAVSIRRATQYLSYLACAYAYSGETRETRKILDEVESISDEFVSPIDVAGIHLCLGQKELALASLEKACEVRDPAVRTLLNDNRMVPLRSDERFQAVLRRVGLIH